MTSDQDRTRARFRQELRRAFNLDDRSARALALAIGARPESVRSWLAGTSLPGVHHAAALGDELSAPHLAELVVTLRTVVCAVCGGRSLDTTRGGSTRLYCSQACKATAVFRRRKDVRRASSAVIAHRLAEHQDAVADHCRDCTLGEGLCPLWTCRLRPVSPLALSPEAASAKRAAEAEAEAEAAA